MSSIIESDSYKYPALAVMLLAILFGYFKGRNVESASGQSRAWTQLPLIAFAIASLGPSALAIMIYLGYKSGLLQPAPSGYRFSTFISSLPIDFAVMNWPFVALYLACRLWPGMARSAMWLSVAAMALPNVLLFSLAPTMLSTVYDAGQGIGFVQAMVMLPTVAMILPGPIAGVFDAGFGIGIVLSALTAPIPLFGLIGWLVGQSIGRMGSNPQPINRRRPLSL
jgi:hypothetical protein